MKHKALIFAAALVVVAVMAFPRSGSAQPGSRPFVFYSEELWGGSYLGVDTEDVTAERMSALHLNEETGVEVTMVDQDAPAGKAGLKEHDVILSINDQKVESVEQLRRLIHEIPAGRTVSIGISRDGQKMTVKAQLTERSKMPDYNFNFNIPAINIPAVHIPQINMPEMDVPNILVVQSPRNSGILIENLTPQLGDYFGVKGGSGVLVRSVDKGSRAEQAGIHAGDVIVKINGSAVNDCSDFSRLLKARTSDKTSVTVVRERKEQTLTLTMPEPKRTGELQECQSIVTDDCMEIMDSDEEAMMVLPSVSTADLNVKVLDGNMTLRKAQLDGLAKELIQHQQEMKKAGAVLMKQSQEQKKQMEKLQQDVIRQHKANEKGWMMQLKRLKPQADI